MLDLREMMPEADVAIEEGATFEPDFASPDETSTSGDESDE